MKTINDFFILEPMKECQVLAGHRGLTREVKFVNISDTPDVVNFLDENHLLLTTGYAFRDDTEKLCNLIRKMHDLNCAGIILKVYRFIKEIPEEVIALANDLSFPIIDLPTEQTLGNLSRHLINYLTDHEAEQLYYALHIQSKFSNMMLKEYSVKSLVEQLGYVLNRPILLLNHRGEPIVNSNHFQKESKQQERAAILKLVHDNVIDARKGTTFLKSDTIIRSFTTYPIPTKNHYPSILVVLDSSTLPYPLSQMAIDQAGNVISFTTIKEQAIDGSAKLIKNNFFSEVVENKIESQKEFIIRSNYYGLDENINSICILATVDKSNDEHDYQIFEKDIGGFHNQIFEQLEDEIANSQLKSVLFTKEKYFVLIIQFEQYDDSEINMINNFIEEIQNKEMEFTLSFGVSSPIQSILDLSKAYSEAEEAVEHGYKLYNKEFINFYKAKELKELLGAIPKKDLAALYENTLKTLAYPETKEDIDMLRTVEVYLNNQCEISETSRNLYIHRNTVKYRIKKIEDILECSLQDANDSLRVRVAILIGTIIIKED